MKGFPCRFCHSANTGFLKEQFDDQGLKLGEIWKCSQCRKNFRVSPEEKIKKTKEK